MWVLFLARRGWRMGFSPHWRSVAIGAAYLRPRPEDLAALRRQTRTIAGFGGRAWSAICRPFAPRNLSVAKRSIDGVIDSLGGEVWNQCR